MSAIIPVLTVELDDITMERLRIIANWMDTAIEDLVEQCVAGGLPAIERDVLGSAAPMV